MNSIRFCLIILSLLGLSACVGTVQDTALPLTNIAAKPKGNIVFGGVHSAVPISQDKIEVFFYPASGGSSKFYYTFYVGDMPLPYTVPSEVLTPDYRGFLKYTVVGLQPAKTYVVKAEAIDQESSDKDTNAVTVVVTTFSNLVADFIGIAGVSNSPGVDGVDSITVRWTHASIDYTNITGSALTDPKTYEIVAVDAERLTPGDMDKTQFGPADGRIVKRVDYDPLINEAIVRGLKSNTKYFVRVQTEHKGSIPDLNYPRLKGEMNSNYMTITTLNASLANINNLDSLQVLKNPGLAQSTSLLLSWTAVTGVFDHLRVYYTAAPNPLSVETGANCIVKSDAQISCKKLLSSVDNTVIANLTSSQTYNVQLVACQNTDCTTYKAGPIKTGNTNPSFAGFSGITSVEVAGNVSEIGKIFLKVPLPDFSQGDFDGYIIGFKTNNGPAYAEISEVAHPTMVIEPYNYRTDNSITISGVDYNLGGLYCFSVYPFVYRTDGSKDSLPNEVWKCNTPEIKAPDKDMFPGLNDSSVLGYDILLAWSGPMGGIYEDYEIYMRTTSGVFSFTEAKNQIDNNVANPDYIRVNVPWYQTSYQFSNYSIGRYKLGILTKFIYGSYGVYRSEDNEQTFVCDIDGVMSGGVFPLNPCSPGI